MSVDQPMVEMRYSSLSAMSNEEIEAQTLVKRGEIDQAIGIYQRLQPISAVCCIILVSCIVKIKVIIIQPSTISNKH